MANNVLTGIFFDTSETAYTSNIVRYFGIHYSGGVVTTSDTRTSESGYYNFNLGDPDWLGQDRQVLDQDDIAIVAWDPETEALESTSLTAFSVYKFKHTGLDTYITDIQLKGSQAPDCSFSVNSSYTIGEQIEVISNASALYQWDFKTNTMYHRDSLFGVPLFSLGIQETLYNFGGGYTTNNTSTYNATGDVQIFVQNTNTFGTVAECSQTIQIKNNEPSTSITWTPEQIRLNEELSISYDTIDPDGVITNIEYYIDGVLITSNTDLNTVLPYTVTEVKSIPLEAKVYWNDGYSDQVSSFTETITVENQPPIIDYVYTNDNESPNDYIFTPTASDPDGTVENVRWIIEYKLPFNGSYAEVLDSGLGTEDPITFNFPNSGEYRVTAQAIDNLGATGEYTEVVNIECATSGIEKVYISNWDLVVTQETINITVEQEPVSEIDIAFEQNEIDIMIEEQEINIELEQNEIHVVFDSNSPQCTI